MDGIARNTTGFDRDLTAVLLPAIGAAVAALAILLALAVGVEILRRAGIARRFVADLDRLVPPPARRIAAALLSLSVMLLGPAPAFASDAPVRDWLAGSTTTTSPVATEDSLTQRAAPSTTPTPLPTDLDEPVIPPIVVPPALPATTLDRLDVLEGDCLWTIAARRLAPGAGNSAIDAAWRAIYALNHDAIGDNPSLIFPGLTLELPPIDQLPYAAP